MNQKCSEKASCSRCAKRTNEHVPFCTWLNAEIPVGLADDPECEGFALKNLRTSNNKAASGSSHAAKSVKSDVDRALNKRPIRKEACPKTVANLKTNTNMATLSSLEKVPDKSLIQTALKFKGFKGSVVMEKICCGKPGCRCHNGALHGPYSYLHYYSNGKVRRRYLSKNMSALLSHSAKELERMLHEAESVLGQEREDSHE